MEQMTTRHKTENLACRLTDDELRGYGDDLAGVVQDISAETDRQTDLKSQMKARMTELEARKSQLAIKISRREEYREVDVIVTHDYANGVVTRDRTDTGKRIHERPLHDDERQPDLPVA